MEQRLSSIQIWVFAPWQPPYGQANWVEQILGEIVSPVMHEYDAQIDAVWLTRYVDSMDKEPYDGLRQPFLMQQDGQEYWRHAKLRFLLNGEIDSFKLRVETLIQNAECIAPLGWQDFDYVSDLGSDRFIRPQANLDERKQRAYLVFQFMNMTTRLMLDSVQKNDLGQWMLEPNEYKEAPTTSFFQSVHHLFCNATEAPMFVEVNVLSPHAAIRAKFPVKF